MTPAVTVTVRDAGPADRAALNRFMTELNRFEHRIRPDRDTGAPAGAAHLDFLLGLIESDGGFTLLAETDGTPVGFLLGLRGAEEGTYVVPDERRFGDISDIFVAEEARGQGVGKALMLAAEGRFRAMGLTRVRITALTANKDAVAAYTATGFTPLYTVLEKPIEASD